MGKRVSINDLPNEVMVQIMVYSGVELSVLKRTCRRWNQIIRENKVLLIHFKLALDNRPAMIKLFRHNYHLHSADKKQHFLKQNQTFMLRYLNLGFFDIYLSSMFNTFMLNMLLILKELQFNDLRARLTRNLMKRPTKQELVRLGILKRIGGNVEQKIMRFKRLLIEENLKTIINSYRQKGHVGNWNAKGHSGSRVKSKSLNEVDVQPIECHEISVNPGVRNIIQMFEGVSKQLESRRMDRNARV